MDGVVDKCNVKYGMGVEDIGDYGIGWTILNETNNGQSEYTYKTAVELDGYPFWAVHNVYSGGGYVFPLKGSIQEMQQRAIELREDGWIDEYTRAIFIEFTVYNPQVNLFGITTYVFEALDSSGLFPMFRIEPVNLLSYYTSAMLFQLACEFIFAIFIIFFIVKEVRNFRLKGCRNYFIRFWTWVELLIIVLSICATVIYYYRLLETNRLLKKFKETHGNGYMKFQYIGYWNELLMNIIGWLVFLATLKFLKLLRFNKKMSLLACTLKYAFKPLCMFGLMFSIVFLAFVQFFYYLYFVTLNDFHTFIHAAETCLQMILGRFNFFAMKNASLVLGPIIFFIYVVSVGYILINMFLTILSDAFTSVREDVNQQSNDYEIVDFIIER